LEKRKKLFIEPKMTTEISLVIREYDLAIRQPNSSGAILFAVCRGKVSEGIDFADSHCRSVVIIGIPYPPLFEPRIVLKKDFLARARSKDPKAMNPEDWYKIEGIRAVNQAMGRIIRHKDDFGVVILADSRFAEMDKAMFPSWIRSAVTTHQVPAQLFKDVERFFAQRGFLVKRSQDALSALPPTPSTVERRERPECRAPADKSKRVDTYDDLVRKYAPAMKRAVLIEEEEEANTLDDSIVVLEEHIVKRPAKKRIRLKANTRIDEGRPVLVDIASSDERTPPPPSAAAANKKNKGTDLNKTRGNWQNPEADDLLTGERA